MVDCWVMLEGQNFNASIFDTQDLSTIRGGSLMLRDLVTTAEGWLKIRFPDAVTRASIGGSIGIWRIRAESADVARAVDALRADLDNGKGKHLGFGIAAVADDGQGYNRQRNRLRAILQHQRLTQSRLPYPTREVAVAQVCPVDLVRPVAKGKTQRIGRQGDPGSVIPTSLSVFDRREYGKKQKQSLVSAELGAENLLSPAARAAMAGDRPFALQIGSIADQPAPDGTLRTNLRDKICVISLDGNGFAKVQDDLLSQPGKDTIETQKEFDETLATLRRKLIARVFEHVIAQGGVGRPTAQEIEVRRELPLPHPAADVIRFELLLWGGDEIMFIVPARLGWTVLQQIAVFAEQEDFFQKSPTFSVGAVFCHQDAPIARVKALADNLTTHIKELKEEGGYGRDGKAHTLFMVEVLESFDHVGLDLGRHLQRRAPKERRPTETDTGDYPKAAIRAARVLDALELEALKDAAEAFAAERGGSLSHGRLRQTAYALHRGAAPGLDYRGDRWGNFIADTAKLIANDAATALAKAAKGLGGDSAYQRGRFFTLLNEYWDYLVPLKPGPRASEPWPHSDSTEETVS